MTWFVVLFGVAVMGVGAYGVVRPSALIEVARSVWKSPAAFPFAVGIRVALGIALLIAAPECRHPTAVRAIGAIALVAAAAGLIMGRARIDGFIAWWIDQAAGFVRGWALVAVAFGGFLVQTAI
jgi:hypothetical protein